LPLGDPIQDRTSARRELHELGAQVRRILPISDEALPLEAISCMLRALAGESHAPRDLRHAPGLFVQRADDLPAGTGLARGAGETIPGCQETAVQAEHLKDEFGEDAARRCMASLNYASELCQHAVIF
jgi:hypothetical protein